MSATPPLAARGAVAAPAASSLPAALKRETFSADNRELPSSQLGRLARREGQGPTGDVAVDSAHDNAKVVHDFYRQVLGRDSIDGKGMPLKSIVHYGEKFNNAFWDGEKMTYGDGDGTTFAPFSKGLDVVAHEMAHGVTERAADLRYRGQSGALNESWSDVFGELVEQWHERPDTFSSVEGARAGEWLIGEDVFTPGKPGDALRSMKAPGTAHPGDPQPAHMRNYKNMTADNGGVHVNSGIPNKAAYEAAVRVGGEKTAKIWYRALTDYLKPTSQFSDAASATVTAARELFPNGSEVQAVRDAWKAVGIEATFLDRSRGGTTPPRGSTPRHADHGRDDGIVPPWILNPGMPLK